MSCMDGFLMVRVFNMIFILILYILLLKS